MTNDNTSLARLQFDSPASDIAVLLQSHPLFAETDLAALTKLLSCGQMLTLRPGDVLIGQGEASDSAHIIIEGSGAIRIETSYGTVNLSIVSARLLSARSGSSWESRVPRLSRQRCRNVLCVSTAATCKNSAARTRNFLPR